MVKVKVERNFRVITEFGASDLSPAITVLRVTHRPTSTRPGVASQAANILHKIKN